MQKIAFAIALCVLAGAGIRPASAFEWYEHKTMGDLAFGAAYRYASKAGIPLELSTAKRGMDAFTNDARLSYGEIVQCVDYFLIPEKLLSQIVYHSRPSSESTQRLREDCTKEGIAFFQATHANHAHFQQDLLTSLEMWHRMAIALGKDGNPVAALWVNAIADHYLHDVFAPGHIVTPRDRMTDVPATAMHDRANRDGALFAPQKIQILKPVLEFLAGDPGSMDELRCPLNSNGRKERAPDKCFSAAQVGKAVSEMISGVKDPIMFRGDTHLWDRDPEQLKQRVWLLAVEVRSILDLFDKSPDGNNITGTDFRYEYPEGKYLKGKPVASFSLGEYKFDETSVAEGNLRLKATDEASGIPPQGHLYRLGDYFPHVGVSAHREHQSSGAKIGRNVYSAEASVFSFTTPKVNDLWPDPGILKGLGAFNITAIVGYSRYQEGGVTGSGPTMRISLAVPETEFSIGPYFRRLSYQSAAGEERKTSRGWRMDTGFSGFATLYLALGRDYGADDQGVLQKGNLWQGGIQIQVPINRVLWMLQ